MNQLTFISDFARMLRRRFVLFILVASAGTAGVIFYALSLDRVYEAYAVVQIQGPQVETDLAGGDVLGSTAQRIQRIEQQLRSRDNLLDVARKFDLFSGPDMTTSDRMDLMREAVQLDSIAGIRQPNGMTSEPSALVITARLSDADKSALVANEFVTRLLERNLRERERRTAETLAFFRREEDRLAREIADLDSRLLGYKHDNSGALPEGMESRRDELVRLEEDERDIRRQLLSLQRQVTMLENGDVPLAPDAEADPAAVELTRLRMHLARMEAVSPNHPSLPRIRDEIAVLEETETGRVRRERALVDEEVALLDRQLGRISERRSQLIEMIRTTPEVEQELTNFTRQREQLQRQFEVANQGWAEAEVEQRLEANRQAERFEVLESALVPEYPVGPSRKKIALAGSVASMALAAALIFALEMMHPVLRTTSQFRRSLGTVPTIALSHVFTGRERRRRRLARVAAVLAILTFLPASIALVDRFVMSFEEMAQAVDGFPIPTF